MLAGVGWLSADTEFHAIKIANIYSIPLESGDYSRLGWFIDVKNMLIRTSEDTTTTIADGFSIPDFGPRFRAKGKGKAFPIRHAHNIFLFFETKKMILTMKIRLIGNFRRRSNNVTRIIEIHRITGKSRVFSSWIWCYSIYDWMNKFSEKNVKFPWRKSHGDVFFSIEK